MLPVRLSDAPVITPPTTLAPVMIPLTLKSVPVAAPIFGEINVGVLENTKLPDPVSSEITPISCNDVVDANCARLPVVVAILDTVPDNPFTLVTPV